ncbi:MAG: hypothetical protein LBN00_12475 [Oscillospiraceae bacterium]|jgi:gas vesicle protein|nr:hypothetical protein [Oscillospiraceae bacterium]
MFASAGCADGAGDESQKLVDWETMEFAEGVLDARNADNGDPDGNESPRDAANAAVTYLETRVAELANEKALTETQREEALVFASLVEEEEPELAERYRDIAKEAETKLAQFDEDIQSAADQLKSAQVQLAEANGQFPEDGEPGDDYEAPPDDGSEPLPNA